MNGRQTHSRTWKSKGEGSICYLIVVRRGRKEKDLLYVVIKDSLSLLCSHYLPYSSIVSFGFLPGLNKISISLVLWALFMKLVLVPVFMKGMDYCLINQLFSQMLRMTALLIELFCHGWDSDCKGSRIAGVRDYQIASSLGRIHNTNISSWIVHQLSVF